MKLQLACARSSEDHLKLDLAKTRLALAKATGGNVSTSHSESSRLLCAINKPTGLQNVDPAIPLSRKSSRDELTSYRPRKAPHTNRYLNPSSCASALNLFDEIYPSTDDDSRGGDALSLRRPNRLNPNSCASGLNLQMQSFALGSDRLNPNSCASGLNLWVAQGSLATSDSRGGGASLRRPNRLNPNSCASGLNLQMQSFALGSDRLNPNSCASGLNLRVAQGLQSLATSGMMSLSSSISRKSSHEIALLIGNSRTLSTSSFGGRRRVGSRSNARLGNNQYPTQVTAKGNSEWGEFK